MDRIKQKAFKIPSPYAVFRVLTVSILSLLLFLAAFSGILDFAVYDTLSCFADGEPRLPAGMTCYYDDDRADVRLFGTIPVKKPEVNVVKTRKLYAGGMAFGVRMFTKGVPVVGMSALPESKKNPAYEAGIRTGDVIVNIDGKEVNSVAEVTSYINESEGKPLEFTVIRDGKTLTFSVTPVSDSSDGGYKAGMWIRDSTAGIGTVTFIDPDTLRFGGLGHGICDSDTGMLLPLLKGTASEVEINGAVKGVPGLPGELRGSFLPDKTGAVYKNDRRGVFGVFSALPEGIGEPMEIALKDEVKDGEAYILSTVNSEGVKAYRVELSSICRNGREDKNFVITVTDKALLDATGGIVRGMSGSPIIQDGKLIGALTHVLVNDPTQGYGIFIENMLAEAEKN